MAFDGPSFIRHVAERLIHEFAFSAGAGTPGLVGAAKEHPARKQLEQLMPGGVAVGSGIVVDSYGSVSKQQDIVIYESLCPVFTHNGTPEATYYPVEGVIAVGEVKSGLGKAELSDSISKIASVKALRRRAEPEDDGRGPLVSFRPYGTGTSFAAVKADQFDQDTKPLDQVLGFVLCERFTLSGKTTLKHLGAECQLRDISLMPNLLTSLKDGSTYPFNSEKNTITLTMREGDGAGFSNDPLGDFAHLLTMIRYFIMRGRTIDREHYELYFRPMGSGAPTFTIEDTIKF